MGGVVRYFLGYGWKPGMGVSALPEVTVWEILLHEVGG